MTYLARGNLALSVCLTMISTLLAFVMTPLSCRWLAGHYVPVDAVGMCKATLQIVVVPVLLGVVCNSRFPKSVAVVSRYGQILSIVAFLLITGGVVAGNADAVIANAGILFLATHLGSF